MNNIDIYKNNAKTVICTVSGLTNLSGYTATLSVKDNISASAVTFDLTGTTNDLVITFEVLPSHTNIDAGSYYYDIVVSNGIKNYTVIQSTLNILESVKY